MSLLWARPCAASLTAVPSSAMRVVRATRKDAERCFGIARAAALVAYQDVFPPDLYDYPGGAIRADWLSALTNPDAETYIAFEADRAVGVVSVSHGVMGTLYVM